MSDDAKAGEEPLNNLPPQKRFITKHTVDGKSVFDTTFEPKVPIQIIDPTAHAAIIYASDFPASFTNEEDVDSYGALLKSPPGISRSKGTIIRTFDMAPSVDSFFHRTISVDYVCVLYGKLQLILDSGESQVLEAGDVLIQRGTLHSWRNIGGTWARILAVVIAAKEVVVGGKAMKEDLGGIQGLDNSE